MEGTLVKSLHSGDPSMKYFRERILIRKDISELGQTRICFPSVAREYSTLYLCWCRGEGFSPRRSGFCTFFHSCLIYTACTGTQPTESDISNQIERRLNSTWPSVLRLRDILVQIRNLRSVPVINGSRFGSRRPENIRILRIQMRNTGTVHLSFFKHKKS